MTKAQLSIQIDELFTSAVSESWVERAVELTLDAAGINSPVELSLVIIDDSAVHVLNRDYRGIDKTTDVIAFALTERADGYDEDFVMPPDDIQHLGEVIISFPQANRQAEEHKHTIRRELTLLIAHGILHLLGYDHDNDNAEKEMKSLENIVLDSIND